MDPDLQRRIAINEATLREINEGIQRGQWPGEESSPIGFRCECARLGCNELIDLTPRDYERVRSNARRFIVRPGHERPEAETIVAAEDGYVVVEKRDAAGALAVETDPRG